MAQVVVNEASLSDIAQALRSKLGTNETFKPSQMGDGVRRLPSASSAPVLITKQISANGTYAASGDNADGYSSVEVSVANSYTASDEGKVVENAALVSQTSKNITANGTHDTTKNNSVVVSVPNSYAASDEGKVVNSGALVAQTSQNITQNGTYDTTLKSEVVVNVSGGGTGGAIVLADCSYKDTSDGTFEYSNSVIITEAGTYRIIADSYANNLTVTINGVAQALTLEVSNNYTRLFYVERTLAVGDVVAISCTSNGKSIAIAVVLNMTGGGGATKDTLMTQGQVSDTSHYMSAYFAETIDFSEYDCFRVNLWRGNNKYSALITSGGQFYIDGDRRYTMQLYTDRISCSQYSGDYVNLYVDVYGYKLDSL